MSSSVVSACHGTRLDTDTLLVRTLFSNTCSAIGCMNVSLQWWLVKTGSQMAPIGLCLFTLFDLDPTLARRSFRKRFVQVPIQFVHGLLA